MLLEIDPQHQKTLPDFLLTEKLLGIKTVCITQVEKRGRRLFHDGIPIERIYNRVIVDELIRRNDRNAVRLSRRSGRRMGRPSQLVFPDQQIFDSVSQSRLGSAHAVSFRRRAGRSRKLGPEAALFLRRPRRDHRAVARRNRAHRGSARNIFCRSASTFAPLVETPHGPTKAEIRMMYIWLDELRAVTTIIRMGRGKMMGVDHNRDMEWVGASAAFIV